MISKAKTLEELAIQKDTILELEAELQQALDCCKRVGELEQELAESKEHHKHYEQHYKTACQVNLSLTAERTRLRAALAAIRESGSKGEAIRIAIQALGEVEG